MLGVGGGVLVQHGEKLFVGVRRGDEALLDLGDVFISAGKLLRFLVFNLCLRGVRGRFCLHSYAIRRREEQVEALQKVRMALKQKLYAVDNTVGSDSLVFELFHDGEETVVYERAVGKDVTNALKELHGVLVLHAVAGGGGSARAKGRMSGGRCIAVLRLKRACIGGRSKVDVGDGGGHWVTLGDGMGGFGCQSGSVCSRGGGTLVHF